MSAIAGIFSRRGAPREPHEITAMLDVMSSRGPDGAAIWRNDHVVMGHGALNATAEAAGERFPLLDPRSGNVIVADVRLDNRSELISLLGLADRRSTEIGDGQLILEAYRAWGEQCVDRFLGDFAFAIWVENKQELFLARDHFGARPLTYFASDELVAFASDSRAVVGLEDVPNTINRDRVFDFLAGTEWTDLTGTFFAQVHRLPPAHSLTISRSEERLHRYWRLPEPEPLLLNNDAEYEEATREVLQLAVTCRLRGRDDVGISLSGGIDSSSIVALAARHGTVHTYSGVSTDPDCVETALIRATNSALETDATTVDRSLVHNVCDPFATVYRQRETPFGNGALLRTLFSAAAHGRRSVMTGVLADEVVAISPGLAMNAFLSAGRPRDVARLVMSRGNLRTHYGGTGLAKSAASEVLHRSERFGRMRDAQRRSRQDKENGLLIDGLHLRLSPDEFERLEDRRRFDAAHWRSRQPGAPGSPRHRAFDAGYAAAALERYDRTGAACGVEVRSPYMDRRVVEHFLSLPAEQLVSGGWSKAVLRRSMVGQVPDSVIWNHGKPHLGWSFTRQWVELDARSYLRDCPTGHPIWDFVDADALSTRPTHESDDDVLFPHLVLALWLEGHSAPEWACGPRSASVQMSP